LHVHNGHHGTGYDTSALVSNSSQNATEVTLCEKGLQSSKTNISVFGATQVGFVPPHNDRMKVTLRKSI
jgi:hypothetical protein